jgi:hypothetical protein
MSDEDNKGGTDDKERLKPLPFKRPPVKATAEKDALLPALNDPYKAAGNPENGEASRLVLVMGKDGFKLGGKAYYFMPYVHIDMGEFGFTANGQCFRFVFAGRQPKLVTVEGRDLLRICDYVSLRRVPWLRMADRDFRAADAVPDDEPIITRIEVTDWLRLEG